MLDEIALAQVHMCKSLEETLGESLNAFCATELQTVAVLQQEAQDSTESAEQSIAKFLNGRGQAVNFGLDEGNASIGSMGGSMNSSLSSLNTSALSPAPRSTGAGDIASRLKNTWRSKLRRGDSNDGGGSGGGSHPIRQGKSSH